MAKQRNTLSKDPRSKLWRRQVLERDNYTCLSCEEPHRSYKPVLPHYIYPHNGNTALAFDVNNGISLCGSCTTWLKGGDYEKVCMRLIVERKIENAQKEKSDD